MAYTKDIEPNTNKGKNTEQKHDSHGQTILSPSKCEQALAKYNCHVDEAEVGEALKKLIAEKVHGNNTKEVKKFLLGSVELTSLSAADNDINIMALVEKVNKFDSAYPDLPHVAAICVYPNFAEVVKDTLEVDGVEIAVVSGSFPSSQTFSEVKIAETALAVKGGATNVDIVLPVGRFLSEDYEGVCEEISELKATCGSAQLKVILENCLLGNLSNVKKASILSMYAGADYIKTSTGKDKGGATPQDVYVMCQAIKEYYEETGIQVGLKPAGGINSVMDAVIFYTIVKEVLGEKWLTNYWFRLGTSRLTNLLLSEITDEETRWF